MAEFLNKYIVKTAKGKGVSFEFSYDLDGNLRKFENFTEELTDVWAKWLAAHFPMKESFLKHTIRLSEGRLESHEIKTGIDFEWFWENYGNKQGSKANAEKYWEGDKKTENSRPITDSDRWEIARCLPKMNFFYKARNREKPIPTTFLNQRRWENSFDL